MLECSGREAVPFSGYNSTEGEISVIHLIVQWLGPELSVLFFLPFHLEALQGFRPNQVWFDGHSGISTRIRRHGQLGCIIQDLEIGKVQWKAMAC